MPTSLVAILVLLRSLIRSRVDLQLENLALRHQIGVLQRSLKKRRKNNCNGPPLLGFSVAYMARLALGISHRQAANGCGLASHGLSLVLDLEGSTGTIGTPRDCPRDSRPHPQFVAGESYLGCTPHSRRVVETRHRHRREQCHEDMVRCRKPPSQTCRTFLDNHVSQLVSVDFFTVPTIRFQVLYVFLVLAHDRRRILHFNVTAHPTAAWTGQQLREAFPFDQLPRYLLRDHDAIFGQDFREQLGDMGIEEVLSTPRSPWQRAYVERVIGTFVVHNKSAVLFRSPLCGAEARAPIRL